MVFRVGGILYLPGEPIEGTERGRERPLDSPRRIFSLLFSLGATPTMVRTDS